MLEVCCGVLSSLALSFAPVSSGRAHPHSEAHCPRCRHGASLTEATPRGVCCWLWLAVPFLFLGLFHFSLDTLYCNHSAPKLLVSRHSPPSFQILGESFLEHKVQCVPRAWIDRGGLLDCFSSRAEAKIKVPLLNNFPVLVTFQHEIYSSKNLKQKSVWK